MKWREENNRRKMTKAGEKARKRLAASESGISKRRQRWRINGGMA
jgi:hypothetical protein